MEVHQVAGNGQTPSQQDIERRAYEIFLSRGGQHGYDVSDWLQAEYELRQMPTSIASPKAAPARGLKAVKAPRARKGKVLKAMPQAA